MDKKWKRQLLLRQRKSSFLRQKIQNPVRRLFQQLRKSIETSKVTNKIHLDQVLPDPCSVRAAHHIIATHLEGKIADQMTESGSSFLMPDGTSRQRLGRVGASLVFIEGQVRALKCQLMGN